MFYKILLGNVHIYIRIHTFNLFKQIFSRNLFSNIFSNHRRRFSQHLCELKARERIITHLAVRRHLYDFFNLVKRKAYIGIR